MDYSAIPSALIGLGLLWRSINFQHVGLLHMGRAGFDGQEKPSDKEIQVLAARSQSSMEENSSTKGIRCDTESICFTYALWELLDFNQDLFCFCLMLMLCLMSYAVIPQSTKINAVK